MRPQALVLVLSAAVLCIASLVRGYPKPSPYPISWELKFEYSHPRRIVVQTPAAAGPEAFWYITYTVTNLTGQEQRFLPLFELLADDGRVIRSDNQIHPAVIDAIRAREKKPHLETVNQIAGTIRLGEDQARDGVAVWREPMRQMGSFTIYVGGLSGEAVMLKDAEGKVVEMAGPDGKKSPVVLRRTLELQYRMLGEEAPPGPEPIEFLGRQWVMR
jgi:hypothetical protein